MTGKATGKTKTSQFYSIRKELYAVNGLIFRLNLIVIPACLQRTVIKAAHSLGHLGMTKTKQMLRKNTGSLN